MRVLLINHVAELGGSEYGLLDIAKHYGPDRCHAVLFEDGPLKERLTQAGIGVTILAAGRGMMGVTREAGRLRAVASAPSVMRAGLALAKLSRGYDVLYANSQKAAVVTMLMAPLVRKPVVWHLHDILSADHFAPLQRRIVVSLANRVARWVIAISEVSKDSFVECGGDPRKVIVVPNGIDVTRFDGLDTLDVETMRAEMGYKDLKLIGLFGRITPWKGQHVLIGALSQLPLDVHALMVGDALFGEDDYKASLIEQARKLGVENRIHWLGYRRDTPQLMRMVDVVVHTSTAPEPFGRVIIEAVLAGRPILASSHGASRELLGESYRWLVAPDDPAALARAIKHMLASPPDEVAAVVEHERERAMRLFSLPQMMHGIERVVALAA